MRLNVWHMLSLLTGVVFHSNQCNALAIKNAQNIPEYILAELRDIALKAGESKVEISSKNRTVKKQVEVMLDYYILCDKGRFANSKELCGIKLAKQVYHSDCHGGFDVFESSFSRRKNVQLMSKALSESLIELGESRTCMNHVVIPGVKTKYIAVDIKPSSIKNRKKFYQAVLANPKVKRFYYPPIRGIEPSRIKESAFHLEFIRQDLETKDNTSEKSN